ncbi:hypothetical protein [Nocardia sp. XZ_19_385]|uniref:phthiocerol/phthiodiolone dimycocerosyl transferase family protein n=1 Tax=Nocardia sp. XZ_19_385 TaxID=2769488 RepID=UPI0018903D57|nr:hypothetical protein [Nocardia sp. XZ_19_385]
MKYRLGLIDHGFVPRKLTVSYVAICTGEIDIALLHKAFELLCRKYPMLRGTIERTGGDCWLDIPDDGSSAAISRTAPGPITDWLAHGNTPLDPAHTLAELTIVPEGERTAVALRVCHAINDATLGFALLEHFWEITAALTGAAVFPDPSPKYPGSLEQAYRARAMDFPAPAVPGTGGVFSIAPVETADETGFRPVPAHRITLSENDTSALLSHARASGTTLHALLAAAIVRAERATITELPGAAAELPMIMFHLADLRPHLHPAADPAEITNALAFAPTVTTCGSGSDLIVLAKDVKAQITAGIDSGAALAVMLAAASVAAQGRVRDSVGNFITNWGVVPELAAPAGVEIVDFRGFATSEPVTWIGYFVSTFARRLSIEPAFSPRFHRPAQIAELRAAIVANLAQFAEIGTNH